MSLNRSSTQRSADYADDERSTFAVRVAAGAKRLWRSGWVLPLLLTLPALAPLLRSAFFVSDDGLFHVYRIAALAEAWEQGVLYPRLFPQFGFGYGQAVFNFYAPLSYAPGALLALLGMSPALAVEWTIALGFVLAALAAHGMGKYLWGTAGGVLAAVVYTYFPYHLADAYVRGALAEHMAFIFLPLIIWSTVAAFREAHPAPAYLWGGLAWAGLVYTHNLTVLLMAPAWVAFVLLLGFLTGRWRRFWGAVGGVAVAVGLSAWVWLPFLAESRYVGIGLGPSDGYLRHLAPLRQLIQTLPLYQYRAPHGTGAVEHPLGWPAALLFFGIAGWLVWRWASRKQAVGAAPALYGLALAGVAAVMTSAPSLPVWRLLQPILGQLQYPWRFMTLVALGLAMAVGVVAAHAATAASRPRRAERLQVQPHPKYMPGALVAISAAAYIVSGLARTPSESLALTATDTWGTAAMWQGDAAAGQVGATWTGEFLPQTVQEQRWALGRPLDGAHSFANGAALAPAPQPQVEMMGYDRVGLRFEGGAPAQVRLHQFHLPAWLGFVDGSRAETYPSGELGLVTIDAPPGTERIDFRFGPTRAVIAASLIVMIAAIAWALTSWSHRWQTRRRDHFGITIAAPLLVGLVATIIANSVGLGVKTWTPTPVRSTVEDVAQLIGYDAVPAKGERALDVTLYWFALRETAQNYKVFVHLLDANGTVISQHDGDPVGGFTPTTRWMQGELIADTHRLPLLKGFAPGDYELRAGMYEVRSGETPGFRNLVVQPAMEDGRVPLGRVEVK